MVAANRGAHMLKLATILVSLAMLQCTATGSTTTESPTTLAADKTTQRITIGTFKARGLWTPSKNKAPAILMLPGSGAQGPEEMIPANMSADGRDTAVFNQLASPFMERGYNVLQLGKPGVDFFAGWPTRFYDQELTANLSWDDLVKNAEAGLEFLRSQSSVDPERIYILGHSEGTEVAVELGVKDGKVAGLILLGYSARSLLDTVRWQVYERGIEHFVKTDVDVNRDGTVTREEAAAWPEFQWTFQEEQTSVTIEEIRTHMAKDKKLADFIAGIRSSKFCQDGHCDRPPLYDETLKFSGVLHVFTGQLDLQTVADEALTLQKKCIAARRTNCHVTIVPGVQHSFNLPKPPRRHPLLDIALAPVEASFLERLARLEI